MSQHVSWRRPRLTIYSLMYDILGCAPIGLYERKLYYRGKLNSLFKPVINEVFKIQIEESYTVEILKGITAYEV